MIAAWKWANNKIEKNKINSQTKFIKKFKYKKLVFWRNIFFITDIDKHVRPKDRKE